MSYPQSEESQRRVRPTPHNPDNLTPEQVGVSDGWRLLDVDEVNSDFNKSNNRSAEKWFHIAHGWHGFWLGTDDKSTYRTKLTRTQLREARGLPQIDSGFEEPSQNGAELLMHEMIASVEAAYAAQQTSDPSAVAAMPKDTHDRCKHGIVTTIPCIECDDEPKEYTVATPISEAAKRCAVECIARIQQAISDAANHESGASEFGIDEIIQRTIERELVSVKVEAQKAYFAIQEQARWIKDLRSQLAEANTVRDASTEQLQEEKKQNKHRRNVCTEPNDWYMVSHELWDKIGMLGGSNKDQFLCFKCLETKLGRTLVISDFPTTHPSGDDMPVNRAIHLGYAMAESRAETAEATVARVVAALRELTAGAPQHPVDCLCSWCIIERALWPVKEGA